MTASIWGAVVFVAALFGIVMAAVRAGARKERDADDLRDTGAALDAERKREALDDEINQDTDLADRARRAGLVRDPKP